MSETLGNALGSRVTSNCPLLTAQHLKVCFIRRSHQGVMPPAFSGDRRPFEMDAENARFSIKRLKDRSHGSPHLLAVSVMNVGRSAVVPNFRWAPAIVMMVSGVGKSLKRISPPPLTWRSMKPGASQRRQGDDGTSAGSSDCGSKDFISDPSMRTNAFSCLVEPSKTWSAATACSPSGHLVRVTFCKFLG